MLSRIAAWVILVFFFFRLSRVHDALLKVYWTCFRTSCCTFALPPWHVITFDTVAFVFAISNAERALNIFGQHGAFWDTFRSLRLSQFYCQSALNCALSSRLSGKNMKRYILSILSGGEGLRVKWFTQATVQRSQPMPARVRALHSRVQLTCFSHYGCWFRLRMHQPKYQTSALQ